MKRAVNLTLFLTISNYTYSSFNRGGMAERLNAAVLKTVKPKGFVGSNPTPSATYDPSSKGELMDPSKQEKPMYEAWLFWTITNTCNLECDYCNASHPREILKKLCYLGFLNSIKIIATNLHSLFQRSREEGFAAIYQETKAKLKPKAAGKIDIPSLIKTLNDTKKIFKISFTGGEPFVVPNFIELCKALTQKHCIGMFTNLTSSKIKKFANEVDPQKVSHIRASLHIKELEKSNLLNRYIENFIWLKSKGFKISTSVVAHPSLGREVGEHRLYFKEKGVDLCFVPFRGRYRGKQYPKAYTEQELKIFGLEAGEMFYQKGKLCNAGYNVGVVFPSGDAQSCFSLDHGLGNVFKKIEFKKSLVRCPFKYCSCPLNRYEPDLFRRACQENSLKSDLSS
jgi:MoaA/NifB/PqqE/SkfB family radical SAM enzyme